LGKRICPVASLTQRPVERAVSMTGRLFASKSIGPLPLALACLYTVHSALP
jgi:hypothetical protein